jgi:hypothetical protein
MKDYLPSMTHDLVNNENIGYILGQLDLFYKVQDCKLIFITHLSFS